MIPRRKKILRMKKTMRKKKRKWLKGAVCVQGPVLFLSGSETSCLLKLSSEEESDSDAFLYGFSSIGGVL